MSVVKQIRNALSSLAFWLHLDEVAEFAWEVRAEVWSFIRKDRSANRGWGESVLISYAGGAAWLFSGIEGYRHHWAVCGVWATVGIVYVCFARKFFLDAAKNIRQQAENDGVKDFRRRSYESDLKGWQSLLEIDPDNSHARFMAKLCQDELERLA